MQQIHINRHKINSIDFEIPELSIPLKPGSECSFEMLIINYSNPTHVHLSVTDGIRKNVVFLHDNPYVTHQEWIPVMVKLPLGSVRSEGEVKVTTGYGSLTKSFKVLIGAKLESSVSKRTMEIDQNLGVPSYSKRMDNSKTDEDSEIHKNRRIFEIPAVGKIFIPVFMVLLVIFILLFTFSFGLINPLYGAVAVSIIMIILIIYAVMHLPIKK